MKSKDYITTPKIFLSHCPELDATYLPSAPPPKPDVFWTSCRYNENDGKGERGVGISCGCPLRCAYCWRSSGASNNSHLCDLCSREKLTNNKPRHSFCICSLSRPNTWQVPLLRQARQIEGSNWVNRQFYEEQLMSASFQPPPPTFSTNCRHAYD
jgi:hypothetical protein